MASTSPVRGDARQIEAMAQERDADLRLLERLDEAVAEAGDVVGQTPRLDADEVGASTLPA